MKHVILTVIGLMLYAMSFGQADYNKSLSGIDWVTIETRAKVDIKGTNGNNLKIVVTQPYDVPDKAKGLKLVGEGGKDNTGVGFYVKEDNGVLSIINLRNAYKGQAEIFIPRDMNIKIMSNGLEDINIESFNGEIEASNTVTGSIDVKNVTGPLTLSSNTGKVSVVFSKVNQESPISISTSTGVIDVSLPANTPANLNLHSTMGEIFSNFDLLQPDKDGLRPVSTKKISSNINNGGVPIRLSSSTGNIYLRKI